MGCKGCEGHSCPVCVNPGSETVNRGFLAAAWVIQGIIVGLVTWFLIF